MSDTHSPHAPAARQPEAAEPPASVDAGAPQPLAGRTLRRAALGVALLLVLAFALALGGRWRAHNLLLDASAAEQARRSPVIVVPVGAAQSGRTLSLPGETASWFESTIYARVNGYVATWRADIGDHVQQGQVLATIETPELDAQLNAARAQMHAAEAEVLVREAEADLARTTYERWRDSPHGVVSDQEREEKRAAHDSAQAKLNAAHAQVALNQAEVDRFLAFSQFKNVVAPFDGTVVERRIDIGNLVTAGSTSSTTPLYRVSQDRPIRIFVEVPQGVSAELRRPGTPVHVHSSALPGSDYPGKVARTAQSINPQARTLKLEIDLANADGAFVPGLYVDVDFTLAPAAGVRVPAAALAFREGGPQVAVVGADGHVHFRGVTITRDEGNLVEIGSGLAAGERVALNIGSRIVEGELVDARDAAAPPAGATEGAR